MKIFWGIALFALAAFGQESNADAIFRLIQSGKLAEARTALDPLLQRNPKAPMLLSADAFLRAQNADHTGAIASARKALAVNPSLDFARNVLALSLIAKGERTEGIQQLEQLLTRSPGNAGALRNLGLAYLQAGNLRKGIPALEKRLRQAPDDHMVRIDLIGALLQSGRRQDALRLEAQVPPEPELLESLCTVLNEREEYGVCAARLKPLRAKGTTSDALEIRWAESLVGLGKVAEANAALNAIPPSNRGESYALVAAWAKAASDDLPGAIQILQSTARQGAASDRVYHALCLILLRGGAAQDALDAAAKGLEQWPDSAVLHFSAGMAHEYLEQHVEAQEALRKSIALDPANGLAHYVQALSQKISGLDWATVSKSFEAALTLRSGDALIASNYAREAARVEDWILAEKLARQAAQSTEYMGAAHSILGRAALARGDFDTAAKYMEIAITHDPQEYAAAYRLGLEFMRRGEKDKARDYFAKYKEFKSLAEEREQERKVLVRLTRMQ